LKEDYLNNKKGEKMNPIKKILGKDVSKNRLGNCPICSNPVNLDWDYVWCKKCGFECSNFEWDRNMWHNLKTTKEARKRFKSGKFLATDWQKKPYAGDWIRGQD